MDGEKGLWRLNYDYQPHGVREGAGGNTCPPRAIGTVAADPSNRFEGVHQGGHSQNDCTPTRRIGGLRRQRRGEAVPVELSVTREIRPIRVYLPTAAVETGLAGCSASRV